MSGKNKMESMLLGDDDSSSGEEENTAKTTPAAADRSQQLKNLYAQKAPQPSPQQQQQVSVPPPAYAQPQQSQGSMTTGSIHSSYSGGSGSAAPAMPPQVAYATRTSSGGGNRMVSASQDPYAPTPVAKIVEKQQQKQALLAAQQRGPSATQRQQYASPNKSPYQPPRPATSEADRKKRKEQFLIFTKVLMKYLEKTDTKLMQDVKRTIHDCAERNKRGEKGYESVTEAMHRSLKRLVPQHIWERARVYMAKMAEQKKEQAKQQQQQQSGGLQPRPLPAAARYPTGSAQTQAYGSSSVNRAPYQPRPPAPQQTSRPTQPYKPRQPYQPDPHHAVNKHQEVSEAVDNAIHLGDWTRTGLIMGQASKSLVEEQWRFLYGNPPLPQAPTRPGWSQNVVSPRTAWALVRSHEHETTSSDVILPTTGPPSVDLTKEEHAATWINEDHAEDDLALRALSEGAQIYLKSVLEKTIHCARQRENLDGIRLWHQHVTQGHRPSLQLQLGCDVSRQWARAQANAALTCKRMEDALCKRTNVAEREWDLTDAGTLENATGMADLALRPPMAAGAESAQAYAQRHLDVLNGKGALSEPPLGRVPRSLQLQVRDFQVAMNLNERHHARAAPPSSNFSF